MKICAINNLYFPYNKGGAEKVIEAVRYFWTQKGHDFFVISSRPKKKSHKNEEIKRDYYFNSWYFDLNKMPRLFRYFWHLYDLFDVITAFKICRVVKKEKPDFILLNNLKGLSYFLPFFLKNLKIKTILILHDVQLIEPSGLIIFEKENRIKSTINRFYIFLCRMLYSGIVFVISPSKWLLDLHVQNDFFKKAIIKKVVPNPAPDFYTECIQHNHGVNNFLFVGQLASHKGVDMLVDVFSRQADFKLNIIGEGHKINKNKYFNIEFLGKMNRNEVLKKMKEADCLVVPSLCYENSPTVIYEAASVGLPVIASRIGGIPELVKYLGGALFNPGDKLDLMKKIIWASKNPKILREMGLKSREKIKQYSVVNYCEQIESIKNISD